jgi:two-component system sensor histidine kinase DctS
LNPPAHAPLAPELPTERRRLLRRWRRALPWVALVGLLLVAQSLLLWLTFSYEIREAQERVETTATALAHEFRLLMERDARTLQALEWDRPSPERWRGEAIEILRARPALLRIERRDKRLGVSGFVDSPFHGALFAQTPRSAADPETAVACVSGARKGAGTFSRTYFLPTETDQGMELIDLCLPIETAGQLDGYLVATYSLTRLLDVVGEDVARTHELSLVESDGTRLARSGSVRGGGVFHAERVVDLPGSALQLRLESSSGPPRIIPHLATALVVGLSLALTAVVMLLVRDVRRRARAEAALAESLAFRKAMEDSLVTGLCARDLQGRITYVNPALCELVGYHPGELLGQAEPPYWPPELLDDYRLRQQERAAGRVPAAREGIEATVLRRNGERVAVVVFEAPLVDGSGRQTGWMSAVVDVSAKHKMEELARQQQERLQATARLVTVGEMASMLSHELNQPLAAIASYAAGSLNLLDADAAERAHPAPPAPQAPAASHAAQAAAKPADPDGTQGLLRQAMQRVAEQAERAGRVIKSVHDFVRRREHATEVVPADQLVEAVLPLVRLQARKSGTRVEVDVPRPVPRVVCDRTMLEQVLLNLTRNGIQSMELHTPAGERELLIRVRQYHPRRVTISVVDRGSGIAPDVAERLFTPFFTTRREGMGLGLSLCRTVIEQHGGELQFENVPSPHGGPPLGVEFRFTLAAADAPTSSSEQPASPPNAAAAGTNAPSTQPQRERA